MRAHCCRLLMCMGVWLLCLPVGVRAADPCAQDHLHAHDVRFVLEKTELRDDTYFFGTFLLQNVGTSNTYMIGGKLRDDGVLDIETMARSIEYMTLNNMWESTIGLPGSSYGPRDVRALEPGESMRVHTALVSRESATSARKFRLLVPTLERARCLVSTPFQAFSRPPAASSMQSELPEEIPQPKPCPKECPDRRSKR